MRVMKHFDRILNAVFLAAAAIGCVNHAGAQTPAVAPAPVARESGGAMPSKLDYVVLASLVDASSLLSLSVYRAPSSGMPVEQKKSASVTDPHDGE